MNNKKQEIALSACIVIWIFIIGVILGTGDFFLEGIATGIGQSIVLLVFYLNSEDENNPSKVEDELGPPEKWVVRIGFLNWKRGKLVDSAEIDNQREMGPLESLYSRSRFGSNNYFKIVYFSNYAGLYEVLRR